MLKIEVPSGTEYALSAVRLPNLFVNVAQYGSCFSANNRDPIHSLLRGSLTVPRMRNTERVLGYPHAQINTTVEVRGDPPQSLRYSAFLDNAWYRSMLGNLADILYARTFPDREGMRHEKGVIHSHYLGHGTVSDSSIPLMYDFILPYTSHGMTVETVLSTSVSRRLVNRVSRANGVSTVLTRSATTSSTVLTLMTELIAGMQAQVGTDFTILLGNKGNVWSIKSMDFTSWTEGSRDKVSLAYTLAWRSWNANTSYLSDRWQDWTYHVSTELTVEEVTPYTGIIPGSGTFFIDGLQLTSQSSWLLSKGDKGHSSVNDTWGNGATIGSGSGSTQGTPVTREYGTVLHLPATNLVSDELPVEPQKGFAQVRGILNDAHARFSTEVRNATYDWLGAHFYSTADALDKYFEIVKAEHIESLTEVGGLISLLPNASGIIRFFTEVKNLELLRAGKTALDIWADQRLKYSYGIAPTLDAVAEFSQHYEAIKNRWTGVGVWGKKTFNGKFIFELPEGSLGREHVTLVSRSKVRVHLEDNSLLLTFLRGKAVGLIPDLSQLWNLKAFSFLTDQFVDIGGRLEDIDDRLSMLLVPCLWCVHSVRFYSNLTSDEMDALKITTFGPESDHPKLFHLERTVSRWLPPLRDSKFDFRKAKLSSDLQTHGALLYSLST